MSDDDNSETHSAGGPKPQQQLTMLFDCEDFATCVGSDVENLCCVIVTSTLCTHSGIRKLVYPKYTAPGGSAAAGAGDGSDAEEEEEDPEGPEDNEDGESSTATFFNEVKQRFITTDKNLHQRRHVRFFHVCACLEEETNVRRLVARDVAFTALGRPPNEVELRELHKTAHTQLVELLHLLEVRSTPCMLFFLRGQPLRYSRMENPAPANKVSPMGQRDSVGAGGANAVKWRKILFNAVVVRNEVLKEYDAEVRNKARLDRKEARRLARLEQKKRQADEEAEEEEDEDDD